MKSAKGTAKHLVVISYDAFSEDNWELASRLPNLSKLIKNGTFSTKLKSVYPTLTYVVHTTMVTGVYPDKHGILHNTPLQPFVDKKDLHWFWFKKDIKVPTIYDAAKEHKMKTAGILWPVTGKAAIKYNIPEIKALKNEDQALKVLKNGSPFFTLGMEMRFGRHRRGIRQPWLDDFTTMCAADTIKRKKPHLLLMHLIELDDAKHNHGTDSSEAEQAILRMDQRLGDMMRAVEEAGIEKDTVFLVVGDHGQINVRHKVRLNQLLKENDLIYEEAGDIKWTAYVQSAGGSAYLHIKPGDAEAEKLVITVLEKAIKDDHYGIERLYAGAELAGLHADPSVRYMLEAKIGYYFDDSLEDSVIGDLDEPGEMRADHGYSPDKPDYKCILIVSGDRIKNDYQLGEINMTDIAPTMAEILGIDFYQSDGRVLNEIFRY